MGRKSWSYFGRLGFLRMAPGGPCVGVWEPGPQLSPWHRARSSTPPVKELGTLVPICKAARAVPPPLSGGVKAVTASWSGVFVNTSFPLWFAEFWGGFSHNGKNPFPVFLFFWNNLIGKTVFIGMMPLLPCLTPSFSVCFILLQSLYRAGDHLGGCVPRGSFATFRSRKPLTQGHSTPVTPCS